MLNDTVNEQRQKAQKQLRDEHKKSVDRMKELKTLLQKLFEENAIGRMSDDNYEMLFNKYQQEQKKLTPLVEELSEKLGVMDDVEDSSRKWMDLLAKYRNLKELEAETVNELIDKIIIHQSEKIDGKRMQRVEIFYRFIGKISA